MSEENNCNDKFDKAIAAAKELRGGVKSFVLVALAAEKNNDGGQSAACAMSGRKSEIVALVSAAGKAVMKDIVLKDLLEDLEK